MATLSMGTPLAHLARILWAARVLGPESWDGGGPPPPPGGNEPAAGAGGEQGLSNDLTDLFRVLEQQQIRALLVGGVALLKYIEGRNTDDIDLVMSVASMERLPGLVVEHRSGDFARARFRSLRVDLLLTRNPLFRLVDERFATMHVFHETQVRCATVEGLVLLKLYALPSLYREGNAQRVALYEGDLTMLCLRHSPAIAPLLQILAAHVTPGELADLRKVTGEIADRVARLKQRTGG